MASLSRILETQTLLCKMPIDKSSQIQIRSHKPSITKLMAPNQAKINKWYKTPMCIDCWHLKSNPSYPCFKNSWHASKVSSGLWSSRQCRRHKILEKCSMKSYQEQIKKKNKDLDRDRFLIKVLRRTLSPHTTPCKTLMISNKWKIWSGKLSFCRKGIQNR